MYIFSFFPDNTSPVDISSVFHDDKFLQWSFVSQYGFAGNALALSARYRVSLGTKGTDVALLKALTKSKLRYKLYYENK